MAEISKINVNGTEYDIALSPKKIVDFAHPVGSYGIYSDVTDEAYRHTLYKENNGIAVHKCFFKLEYNTISGEDSKIFRVDLKNDSSEKKCYIVDLKGQYSFSYVGQESWGLFNSREIIPYDGVKGEPFEIELIKPYAFNFILKRGETRYSFYGEMTFMEWS